MSEAGLTQTNPIADQYKGILPEKTGSTSIEFSSGDDNITLEITGHAGFIRASQGIPLRVYPHLSNTIYDASYGTVEYESNHEDRIFEVVRFEGNTEAGFAKYPDRIDSYELMGDIIAANGDPIAADGSREGIKEPDSYVGDSGKPITISYDDSKRQLVASAACFATFKVFYFAKYALIRYKPEETVNTGSGFWGYRWGTYTYGTVVAQAGSVFDTFDVPPPTQQESIKSAELWRVTSTTIANEAGQWEKPDTGWPDGSPAYTIGGSPPNPGAGYQENERVHQIGTIDTEGFITIQDNRVDQSAGPSGVFSPVFTGYRRLGTLASDPDFSGAVSSFSSSDEAFIDSRLGSYGLEWETMDGD